MTNDDLNKHWIEQIHYEIRDLHRCKTDGNRLYFGDLYNEEKNPFMHNLPQWFKFDWTLEQFLCVLHHQKSNFHFIEFDFNPKISTTITINGIPCEPKETINFNPRAKSIQEIQERLRKHYSADEWRILTPKIVKGEISNPASPVEWIKLCDTLNIEATNSMKEYADHGLKKELFINQFDWKNFYCESNAKIIEKILDYGKTTINDLSSVFFYKEQTVDGNKINASILIDRLNKVFKAWLDEFEKTNNDRLGFILINSNERYLAIKNQDVLFNADSLLALFISEGLLPSEISRLPRLPREKIGFDPIPDYYERYASIASSGGEVLIKVPENYEEKLPTTYTYEETVELFKKCGLSKSEIEIACRENHLGLYIRVDERNIRSNMNYISGSIDIFRKQNCGNPYYLKRYQGLERLPIINWDGDDIMNCLFVEGSLKVKRNSDDFRHDLLLQVTDIESKFHIEKKLNFKGKNEIKITDLVFLKEEVIKLEMVQYNLTKKRDAWPGNVNFYKSIYDDPKQEEAEFFNQISSVNQELLEVNYQRTLNTDKLKISKAAYLFFGITYESNSEKNMQPYIDSAIEAIEKAAISEEIKFINENLGYIDKVSFVAWAITKGCHKRLEKYALENGIMPYQKPNNSLIIDESISEIAEDFFAEKEIWEIRSAICFLLRIKYKKHSLSYLSDPNINEFNKVIELVVDAVLTKQLQLPPQIIPIFEIKTGLKEKEIRYPEDFEHALPGIEAKLPYSGFRVYRDSFLPWVATKGYALPEDLQQYLPCTKRVEAVMPAQSSSLSEIGKRGAAASNERFEVPKAKAREEAKRLLGVNKNYTQTELIERIKTLFEAEEITNSGGIYNDATIRRWIGPVVPEEHKKRGRPKIK